MSDSPCRPLPRGCRTSSAASTSTPRTGRSLDLHRPQHRRGVRHGAGSGAADVDRALRAAADALRRLVPTRRRRSAAWRCSGSPTPSRPGPRTWSRAECENTGKPVALMRVRGDPAARSTRSASSPAPPGMLDGPRAGEYMAGHTSFVRREPIGVCGPGDAVELPDDDGGLEVRARPWPPATPWCSSRPTPRRRRPLLMAEIMAEFLPPGVFNVVCGDRDTGRALVVARDPADGVDHRQRPGRHGGRDRGRPGPQAGPPRAGRQGAGHRLRRRRRRRGGRGHRRGRLLQRRPGLHGGDPRAGRAPACTTTSWPRWPSRRATRRSAGPTMRTPTTGRSTTRPSWRGCAASSSGCPATPRWSPAGDPVGDRGYFYAADRRRRPAPGRRDHPVRGVRPGHHRAAVHRRGRGAARGPTASSTAWPPACGPRTTAGPCAWPSELDFGCVWINTHIPLVAEMPHGGFKHSGYGKDLSLYGFEDYTRIKHVMSYIGG